MTEPNRRRYITATRYFVSKSGKWEIAERPDRQLFKRRAGGPWRTLAHPPIDAETTRLIIDVPGLLIARPIEFLRIKLPRMPRLPA